MSPVMQRFLRRLLGGGALVFGLMTITAGGRMLFGDAAGRAEAGQIVEFVLLFNFIAGFAYLAAGAASLMDWPWSIPLARALAGATLLTFLAMGFHIGSGGGFESRTVVAMTLRSAFWIVQAVSLPYVIERSHVSPPPHL